MMMKQYIFSAVCLMSGVLCMSSCNEDKQAKPYTPDYEIVPEYTNADTWTAYEAFNDNLLDPDKNIYKTSTAYTAATDRNNGAAAIWCQPIYWDMAMNAYKRAKAEGDTERENKYKQLCDDLFAGNKAHYVNFDFDDNNENTGWFIYDDIQWWTITLARAYELFKVEEYRSLAEASFARVCTGSGNIAMDDDVWVFTGVTSAETDASNFGFILINQRTKEARYYKSPGATEISAQESATDAVQNYGYQATFPILLGIDGNPTYFMSLYGDSNTVKGYAFVSLKDKTVVGTGLLDTAKSDAKALNNAIENYIDALKEKGIADNVDKSNIIVDESKINESNNADITDDNNANNNANDNANNTENETTTKPSKETAKGTVTGTVEDIKTSVNDGNSVYYLKVDGKYYYINVGDCMEVMLVNKGDTVEITTDGGKGTFIQAKNVTVK